MATLSAKAQVGPPGRLAARAIRDEAFPGHLASSLGFWAATLISLLNIVYMAILGSLALSGLVLPPPEPAQTVLAVITLLSAPALVVLFTAIQYHTPADKKILSQVSLAFMFALMVLTCTNRFVQLTVVRQGIAAGKDTEIARFLPYDPGSIMNAMEILAWSLFLGLAALFAAPVFGGRGRRDESSSESSGDRLEQWIRWMLLVTGALSLIAFFGYLTSWTPLAYAAPIAWGITAPVTFFLMVPFFWRAQRQSRKAIDPSTGSGSGMGPTEKQ